MHGSRAALQFGLRALFAVINLAGLLFAAFHYGPEFGLGLSVLLATYCVIFVVLWALAAWMERRGHRPARRPHAPRGFDLGTIGAAALVVEVALLIVLFIWGIEAAGR